MKRKNKFLKRWEDLSPARKLIIGFATAIVLGTILLKMPFSLKEGIKIGIIDSLFTIVSAVCVTGLSVVNVAETFSPVGAGIILFFIQIGGLGVMTFSTMLFLIVGKKMSFQTRELLKEERNSENNGGVSRFIRILLLTVFFIESIGAVILTYEFKKIIPINNAIFYGIFHSISAFCNAGFSLFVDNLESFKHNSLVSFTIGYLIILGGLGFTVINSFIMVVRKGINRFNLTSKLGLTVSITLTVLGMVLFFLIEYNNNSTIGELNFYEKVVASFFQSVSLRTAGFNTVPLGNIKSATVLISCLFMFIGASPGSTGGGIKTTTFGVIIFYVFGILRKKENVEIFNRRIDWEIMNKALAILVISIMYLIVVITFILAIDDLEFHKVVYEVISAFSTAGLSMGITSDLGLISRLIIIITMFIGRLGPLTIAIAFSNAKRKSFFKYPKEDILIG